MHFNIKKLKNKYIYYFIYKNNLIIANKVINVPYLTFIKKIEK